MILYIGLMHLAAAYGGYQVFLGNCHWYTLLWALALWPISGLGITAGAHRLWAHRSYKASYGLRVGLMLCNSVANQGTIYHWARDHRVHHKHAETDADPHNAKRGFWFSHVGWLFVKKHPDVVTAGARLSYADLAEDSVVMFQRSVDPWFALAMCFLMPAYVASVGWEEDFWRALWVAGTLRYVAVLHFTWCVNSLAHMFGDRPYDKRIHATENAFVSVVAIGEGWHNWHHKYPFDYAASEFGWDKQRNWTKVFLDMMGVMGLATDFKRATYVWEKQKRKNEVKMPLLEGERSEPFVVK
jgi:stearoyl-CoA desaturase (delta-9 desaturase)